MASLFPCCPVRAKKWTGFYMISASVMKELMFVKESPDRKKVKYDI